MSTVKTRPLLYSAPMVRATLSDKKTQTRRIVKPQPIIGPSLRESALLSARPMKRGQYEYMGGDGVEIGLKPKYGQVGDRLYVKEAAWMFCERRPNGTTKGGRPKWHYVPLESAPVHYVADHTKKPPFDVVHPETGNEWDWRFKVGRFLPRWASRIDLEIVSVRVERLQDISEADAIAEGVHELPLQENEPGAWWTGDVSKGTALHARTPVAAYRKLWEAINGPGSWDANSWVWAITFRRVRPTGQGATE